MRLELPKRRNRHLTRRSRDQVESGRWPPPRPMPGTRPIFLQPLMQMMIRRGTARRQKQPRWSAGRRRACCGGFRRGHTTTEPLSGDQCVCCKLEKPRWRENRRHSVTLLARERPWTGFDDWAREHSPEKSPFHIAYCGACQAWEKPYWQRFSQQNLRGVCGGAGTIIPRRVGVECYQDQIARFPLHRRIPSP